MPAEIDLNGNAPLVIQLLNGVRSFIRDVGTPITILLFVGLIYTGYLHSPLTDLAQENQVILAQHQMLMAEARTTRSALWAIYGLVRTQCRNNPEMKDKQEQCDAVTRPPSGKTGDDGAMPLP